MNAAPKFTLADIYRAFGSNFEPLDDERLTPTLLAVEALDGVVRELRLLIEAVHEEIEPELIGDVLHNMWTRAQCARDLVHASVLAGKPKAPTAFEQWSAENEATHAEGRKRAEQLAKLDAAGSLKRRTRKARRA